MEGYRELKLRQQQEITSPLGFAFGNKIAIGSPPLLLFLCREQQSERIFPRFAPCMRLSPHTALHQYRLIVACM